jgi:casein kinase 1
VLLLTKVCRNLKFDETPNYNYCRKLLREVFEANGYALDYVYDWTVKQQVRHQVLSYTVKQQLRH